MNKALFLDRDGILNIDKTYVHRFEDILWVSGVFELIEYANNNGFIVIVLTNQSGVAQGMYKEEDVLILHKKMSDFLNNKNLKIDDWFYCTEYDSDRRKPRPGMMLEAQKKYDIDFSRSFMIGDKATDIMDLQNGPKTFLLKGNYPLEVVVKNGCAEIFTSLGDILKRIQSLDS
jgi:D-glycero-D-manno-heptose 1,7-bisphosphate phosphatase